MTELQSLICSKFKINFCYRKWIPIKCIYHSDRHPSAGIYFTDTYGWYHCLGCKAKYGLTQLVSSDELIKVSRNEEMIDMEDQNLLDYEQEAEIESLKPSLNEVDLLEKFIDTKNISPDTIISLGGYVSNEGYLVFEYGNKKKRVGRYLGNDKKKPRFVNEGGNKGLFGEELLREFDDVFLVEGITDFLSMKEIGFGNVVCSFGAELSEEQAYLLKDKTVFILYDRDFAGYKGALQAYQKIKEYKGTPIIFELYSVVTYEKIDVNFLVSTDKDEFVSWLDECRLKYASTDKGYSEKFMNKKKLKHYKSCLPIIKFTEGLYVFTGLAGVGKTTLAIELVDNFCKQGADTLYCNYDLPKDQIVSRLASRYSRYSWEEIESDHSILEDKAIVNVNLILNKTKIENNLTVEEIKHSMRHYQCLVVDYLQRIPSRESDTRLAIEGNLAVLSELASDCGKTVICISRMPASAFGRTDGHVFSGSAAIEYNAQAAVVLSKEDDDVICFNIIKNTRGKTGIPFFLKSDYAHQKLSETNLKQIKERLFNDHL